MSLLRWTAGILGTRISFVLIALHHLQGLRTSAATWGPFTYEREGGNVRIQWVRGSDSPDRRLVIPESIEGLPVTAIEGLDVSGMSIIREVVIPPSVTSINPGAFWGTALERIEVSPMNLAYLSQDGVLFNHERTRLVRFPSGRSGEYSVPEGVTHIGDGGFAGCSGLTRVAIPASVVQIEDTAFFGCSALTGIELPAALSRIGKAAFAECTRLIDVSIPDSVTQLGNGMFEGCLSLTHASIGDGATDVGDWTFSGCPNLVRVSLGRSVSRLGQTAFGTLDKAPQMLRSIEVVAGNPAFTSREGILFEAGGRTLLRCPHGLKDDFLIPAGTTSIASNAFSDCFGAAGFPGRIDEVGLFDRALSAEQVADLYAAGFGTPPPLRFSRSGEQLSLMWSGGVLQSATTLGNDGQPAGWADLTAATSPLTLSQTNSANFFRVRTP